VWQQRNSVDRGRALKTTRIVCWLLDDTIRPSIYKSFPYTRTL